MSPTPNYSGGGNFTGTGSPNPTKLFIPDKDAMDGPTQTMARTLEQFINSLNSPTGAVSTDRLGLLGVNSGPSSIRWASQFDSSGSSITVPGGVGTGTTIQTGPAGVYAFSISTGFAMTGPYSTTLILQWQDSHYGHLLISSEQVSATSGSTTYQLMVAFTYFFPANTVHTFSAANFNVSTSSVIYVQRIG